MNRPLLSLRGISKTYQVGTGLIPVIREIELKLDRGAYASIMGPSGSGKSTLLNIIGCLDRPSSGSYILDDKEVVSLDDSEVSRLRGRCIGFIFQSFQLISNMTVLDNVLLPTIYQAQNGENQREKALNLIEKVGLGHRITHKPNQLSGGERQRVAIARSLINDPALLLADEPTGNLDSSTEKEILKMIEYIHERSGTTVVMVTHNPEIARRSTKRFTMLDGVLTKEEP